MHKEIDKILLGFGKRTLHEDGTSTVTFLWKRLLVFIVVSTTALYLLIASSIYFYVHHHKDYRTITYTDCLLLPFQFDSYMAKIGRMQIATAKHQLREQNYSQAFSLLKTGLRRAPEAEEARLILSKFYEKRRPQMAVEILEVGLEGAKENLEYHKHYYQLLDQLHEDQKIIEQARNALKDNPSRETQTVHVYYQARAHMLRGRYEQALNTLKTHKMESTLDGMVLKSMIRFQMGDRERAIDIIERIMEQHPRAPSNLHARRTQYYLRSEKNSKARQAAILWQIAAPDSPQPYLSQLNAIHQSSAPKKVERIKQLTEHFTENFGDNRKAMLQLISQLAKYGQTELAHNIYVHAKKQSDWNQTQFGIHVVRARIERGKYKAALRISENQLNPHADKMDSKTKQLWNAMLTIIKQQTDNIQQATIHFQKLTQSLQLKASQIMELADMFEEKDMHTHALELLNKARAIHSKRSDILSKYIHLKWEAGENPYKLIPDLKSLQKMRPPPIELREKIQRIHSSDRFLFTSLKN